MSDGRLPLPGSAPQPAAPPGEGVRSSSALDPHLILTVTVTVRRRNSAQAVQLDRQLLSGAPSDVSLQQAAEALSADPQDMAGVRSFLEGQGLTVTAESLPARTLKAEGSVEQMDRAFSTNLYWAENPDGNRYVSYTGELSVPESLGGVIQSVIGLDGRPIAAGNSQP